MRRAALLLTLAVAGCADASRSDEPPPRAAGSESRLTALRETRPVPHRGDAADDPALWIDRDAPARSAIVGTDKQGGLGVYDLRGRELQYIAGGRPNNVDLRRDVRVGGQLVTVVAAEEREHDQIVLYRLDPATRRLHSVAARRIHTGMNVYGSCMYRGAGDELYVFVSSREGRVRQFRLFARGERLVAELVREFDVGGTTEACVADDATGQLYVGEEERGIWRYGAEPDAGARRTHVDGMGRRGHLTADVEGLALVQPRDGARYLVASNQGDNSYNVYRRGERDEYVTTFRIVTGAIDGVHDTDGIDATALPLGPDFPTGVFVAQDGGNGDRNQNFKLVRWDLAEIVRRAPDRRDL